MKDGVLKWTHGPSFEEAGIGFRLWAPKEEQIALMIDGRDPVAMTPNGDGFFEVFVNGLVCGRTLHVCAVQWTTRSRSSVSFSA